MFVRPLEIKDNDEVYDIVIQGSSDSDFGTDTNIVELAAINLSAAEVKRTDCNKDDSTGRFKPCILTMRMTVHITVILREFTRSCRYSCNGYQHAHTVPCSKRGHYVWILLKVVRSRARGLSKSKTNLWVMPQ